MGELYTGPLAFEAPSSRLCGRDGVMVTPLPTFPLLQPSCSNLEAAFFLVSRLWKFFISVMPQPRNNKTISIHQMQACIAQTYSWSRKGYMLSLGNICRHARLAKRCASICLLYELLFCPADCGQGTER